MIIRMLDVEGKLKRADMLITGEVSAVDASIKRASALAAAKGTYLDSSVIAHPDRKMISSIL